MTDRFPAELADRHGHMEDQFRNFFARAGGDDSYYIYNTHEGDVPSRRGECDGYLISGSSYGVYEGVEWFAPLFDFIRRAATDGEKLMGICFGHQAIAHALGGRVEKASNGWGIGVHAYDVVGPAAWMEPSAPRISLLVSHQDQVVEPPRGARVNAASAFCPNAMMSLGDRIFSMQGHPEHVRDFTGTLIERRRHQLGDRLAADAVASLEESTDELLVASWITRFFSGR